MRIVLLMTQSLQSPGAVGRFMPLARELHNLGHQVTVLGLYHDRTGWDRRPVTVDGVTVQYVGSMHVRKVGNRKSYYGPLLLLWILAQATLGAIVALWRIPCDVIQVCKPHPQNSLAAWCVGKLRRIPVFVDCDDYEAVNNRFAGKWQQRSVAWFEDWAIRSAQGVTAGNTFLRDRALALGVAPERVVLMHNGVDRARFSVLAAADAAERVAELQRRHYGLSSHRVLFLGTVSLVSHGLDILLHAWVHVARSVPDARLLVVGAGEDFDHIVAMASELGLGESVEFAGKVAGELVPFYYRTAAITVDPMHSSVPAESSLSLKLVESIAAGVPCVTANIGDRAAVAGDAGLAVAPDDAQALADGLILLLTQPALRDEMRAATGRVAAPFYWDVKVAQFLHLYSRP